MGPIEAKVATGSVTWLAASYLSTLLVELVPWLKEHLTADQQLNLPIVISWLLATFVAYYTPHTHRPDLPPLVTPIPVQPSVTVSTTNPPQTRTGGWPE